MFTSPETWHGLYQVQNLSHYFLFLLLWCPGRGCYAYRNGILWLAHVCHVSACTESIIKNVGQMLSCIANNLLQDRFDVHRYSYMMHDVIPAVLLWELLKKKKKQQFDDHFANLHIQMWLMELCNQSTLQKDCCNEYATLWLWASPPNKTKTGEQTQVFRLNAIRSISTVGTRNYFSSWDAVPRTFFSSCSTVD